jgi:hypothetical protein
MIRRTILGGLAALAAPFRARAQEAAPDAPPGLSDTDPAAYQDLVDRTHAALDRRWASVGAVEGDVIGEMIPSALMGGIAWPSPLKAYQVIRRPGAVILATHGLAAPYDEAGDDVPGNGLGVELFIETDDIPAELSGAPGDIGRIKESWAFELLEHLADMVAGDDGVRGYLDRNGAVSTEIPGVARSRTIKAQVPRRFITRDDSIGFIIGRPAPDFPQLVEDTPQRPVLLAPIVLLTAPELERVRDGGREARTGIIDALAKRPHGWRSDLQRKSVV